MGETFRETFRKLDAIQRAQTPEQWHAQYKQFYPDITPQESGELYPLFLMATDPAYSRKQQTAFFREYQRRLAPIKKRNPQQREQELFTWME